MKKEVFKKTALTSLRSFVIPVLLTAAVLLLVGYGLDQTEQSSKSEGKRVLEESVRRATVTCYAIEGKYPESLEYIEKNYGIYFDKEKYAVHYSIFASNYMPDIVVIELN